MLDNNRTKPFTCSNCNTSFGVRDSNVLVTVTFTTTMDRSRPFTCGKCGEVTMFTVDRRKKKRGVVKLGVKI